MKLSMQFRLNGVIAASLCLTPLWGAQNNPQQLDASFVVRQIDAAVQNRFDKVAEFTDVEHYAVYRGKDETHPAAAMTVKVTYRKGVGKSYKILSQSGSGIVQRFGLRPLLENEKAINDPAHVADSWFTSANYEMKLKTGVIQRLNGEECIAVAITPRHRAPNMIDGILWVSAKDYQIVEIDGIASKSPSIWAGTTHMMRKYVDVDGFAMATHARAESDSFLFGRTVVKIDYGDYHLELAPPK